MTLHQSYEALAAAVPGGVFRPGDPAYEESTLSMLGQGTPDLVVRPRAASEVAAAVRTAREQGAGLTIRSGGHSLAGLSIARDGLLLDLRELNRIDLDTSTGTVSIGGGAVWGDVARYLQPHGLALTSGDTASVGVGGLTVGGGIGWMVRRHGLAIDNLVGAEIVTADGQVRQVSAEEDPELFWAIRGGGGSFGVVTRFDFRAQEAPVVTFGTVVLALEDARSLLGAWWALQEGADERLTTILTLMPPMQRPAMAMLGICFAGPREQAAPLVDALVALGTVLSNDVSERPYAEVLAVHEPGEGPQGVRPVMSNTFLPALDEEAIGKVTAVYESGAMVSVRALGGAFSRVATDATAFAHRSAAAMVLGARFVPVDVEGPVDITGWAEVADLGTGSYVNFISTATPEDSAAAYPPATQERLARVKAAVDPDGLFTRAVAVSV